MVRKSVHMRKPRVVTLQKSLHNSLEKRQLDFSRSGTDKSPSKSVSGSLLSYDGQLHGMNSVSGQLLTCIFYLLCISQITKTVFSLCHKKGRSILLTFLYNYNVMSVLLLVTIMIVCMKVIPAVINYRMRA